MKKVILILFLSLGLGLGLSAQTGNFSTVEHHTVGSLDKFGKLELTKIYVDLVHKVNMLMPYIPFNQKGDAISLSGMGIPSTKDNNGFVKKLDSSSGTHNEVLDETLNNIIPYADKDDIIKSILFLQNVIEKIEAGI